MDPHIEAMAGGDGVSVHAGFPNPADERRGQSGLALDFNRWLIKHPTSTYLFRVAGHQRADQGIYDGDVAVVDRAVQAGPGDLVVASRDGGLVVCRRHRLTPEDRQWGVVTALIHPFRP